MPTPEIASFIRDHFRSVWALELLLFLKRNAATGWSNDALVEALRASEAIVAKCLEELLAGGLILTDDDGHSQYAPATDGLRKLVDDTQQLYDKKPDAVRRLIISSSGVGLSAFADSFRLWKD
jgi:hypothetical protein